jgi:hypothetical protein
VETLAQMYLLVLQSGKPVLLSGAEMTEAIGKFATYRTAR